MVDQRRSKIGVLMGWRHPPGVPKLNAEVTASLPKIWSSKEWESYSSSQGFFRSSELKAIDAAVAEYQGAFGSDREKAIGALQKLQLALDGWVLSKEVKYGKAWEQKAQRASVIRLLRTQAFSAWVPPRPISEETRRIVRTHEHERQKLFLQLFAGKRILPRTLAELEVARRKALSDPNKAGGRAVTAIENEQERQGKKAEDASTILSALEDLGRLVAPEIERLCQKAGQALEAALRELEAVIKAMLEPAIELVREALRRWREFKEDIRSALLQAAQLVRDLVASIIKAISDWIEEVKTQVTELVRLFIAEVKEKLQVVIEAMKEAAQLILRPLSEVAETLKKALEAAVKTIKVAYQFVSEKIDEVYQKTARQLGKAWEILTSFGAWFVDKASDVLEYIKRAVKRATEAVKDLVRRVFRELARMLSSLADEFKEAYETAIAMFEAVKSAIGRGIKAAADALSRVLKAIFGLDFIDMVMEFVPYAGTAVKLGKLAKQWYEAYKGHAKLSEAKKKIAEADFSTVPEVQVALKGLKSMLTSSFEEDLAAAAAGTLACGIKIAAEASFVGAAVSTAVGAASVLGSAIYRMYRFGMQLIEVKKVNALLQKVSATGDGARIVDVLKASPLVCCYVLCLTPPALLINHHFAISAEKLADQGSARAYEYASNALVARTQKVHFQVALTESEQFEYFEKMELSPLVQEASALLDKAEFAFPDFLERIESGEPLGLDEIIAGKLKDSAQGAAQDAAKTAVVGEKAASTPDEAALWPSISLAPEYVVV